MTRSRSFAASTPSPRRCRPKLAREAEALEKELETLREEWEAAGEDAEEPARIGKIEDRLDAIEDKRGAGRLDAGATCHGGRGRSPSATMARPDIERGLVRPEDMPKKEQAREARERRRASAEAEDDQSPALSAALIESLTAHRSAALAAELQQRPDVALAAIVHAFAVAHPAATVSRMTAALQSSPPRNRSTASKARRLSRRWKQAREKWSRMLPQDEDDLWAWCLEQKQSVLLDLLAFCAATTINAVRLKSDRPDAERLHHADRLAAALDLDMKAWFTPDAANYFSRVSKPQILDAIREAKGQPPAPAWEKLKKAELAQEAERQIAGSGWLPELLRACGIEGAAGANADRSRGRRLHFCIMWRGFAQGNQIALKWLVEP